MFWLEHGDKLCKGAQHTFNNWFNDLQIEINIQIEFYDCVFPSSGTVWRSTFYVCLAYKLLTKMIVTCHVAMNSYTYRVKSSDLMARIAQYGNIANTYICGFFFPFQQRFSSNWFEPLIRLSWITVPAEMKHEGNLELSNSVYVIQSQICAFELGIICVQCKCLTTATIQTTMSFRRFSMLISLRSKYKLRVRDKIQ